MDRWYLCGLGSNIRPDENLPQAVARLAARYGPIWLSAVIHTRPEGMSTPNPFLNALAVFASELSPEQLKAELNALEEAMGRDRSDPMSSRKDRPIDVDILEVRRQRAFTGATIEEPYYRRLFQGEPAVAGVSLQLEGQRLGQSPATIYRNQGPGHEIVVEQGEQLNHYAVKATFPG
ncbi:2-amino-4-hydroxy-6-hydroxymethyldihydropteridine diphosphokinase [uncultured Marinobacter sp.]|uniref:2-amino-4-hydroxy-6- hydroxymethyldihydropteridine diphosphokinase n=1 Tax=uncultured Marinobacter sp. TaxID=187379 RepID=UPI0030D9FDB4